MFGFLRRARLATCFTCGLRFKERTRRPCPRCGSLSRLVAFALNDAATVDDRVV